MEVTISELAYLRLLRERMPNASQQHVKTMMDSQIGAEGRKQIIKDANND